MIKVSVLYPNDEGTRFDIDYYCNNHIPLVQELVGDALRGVQVEHGLAGGEPGSPPTYHAMGHLLFDSVESFQSAFAPHGAKILADVPNYTDVQPVLQVSEIKLS